jgi:hypothetical protein
MTALAGDAQNLDTPSAPATSLTGLAESARDRLTLAPVGISEEVVV